jgi:CBS domain-containing protein
MGKTVRDMMSTRPRCVTPDTAASEAAQIMRAEDVGALPIVAEPDALVGIVTDRDLVLRVLADDLDPRTTQVGEIASRDVVTVAPDQDLDDALVLMAQQQVRRLPVVDQDNRLVGILAQADVALGEREKTVGEVVAEISQPADGPRV